MPDTGEVMKAQPARQNPNDEPRPACDGISRFDEPCNESAAMFCDKCERWFCAAHAQDELWHPCMLEPSDEGGEG
jgi:hypothetical protein